MEGTTITTASRQWATRPDDERYVSLLDMREHFRTQREHSRSAVVSSRAVTCEPRGNDALLVAGSAGVGYEPTNWAFGQLATLAGAPAGYLRSLPAPLAADCVNYGLRYTREPEEIGLLLSRNGSNELRAATGPRYGRVWNAEVVEALVNRFGDGVTGSWKVPGEFGKVVTVTKANTTLYASDRDCFIFLADEEHRIELPNRRDGQGGSLARGFFVWNSEVGAATLGISAFLFDYVCCNRIIWGAQQLGTVKVRHTVTAPDRFIEEITPALHAYANGSAAPVRQLIIEAQSKRIDNVADWLTTRYSKSLATQMMETHLAEEHRPIDSLWDVATAITAVARSVPHQDARVQLERQAGEILTLAA